MTIAAVFDRVEAGPRQTTLVYILFALLSVVLFVLSTRHGIGILPDSTRYMQISPVPYDAPLYSWLLQVGRIIGIGYDAMAYATGLLLYVANTLLILHIINIVVGRKLYLLVLAGLLITLVPQYIRAHTVAMSEPLFLFLILSTILLLVRFIESQDRRLLVAAGVTLGLCMLTRFTAAPFAVAFAALLLLGGAGSSLSRRLSNIAILAAVSGLLFALWAVGSKLLIGRATGRAFAFNGNPDDERWLSGIDSLSAFMMPTFVPAVVRYPLTLLLVLLAVYVTYRACVRVSRAGVPAKTDLLTAVFGLSAGLYMIFVVLSVMIEANLPINGRYLLPVYIALVVVLFSGLAVRKENDGMQAAVLLVLALAVTVIGGHVIRSASQTMEAYRDGIGYQGPKWRNSPIILAIRQLPQDAQIFSNGADAINYLTGRNAVMVPEKFARRTGVEDSNNPYLEQLAALKSALQKGNAYVVFVDGVDWRFYQVTEEDLRKDAALKVMQTQADGRIYGP